MNDHPNLSSSIAVGDHALARAEHAAIHRLLNTYLRETGQFDPSLAQANEVPDEVGSRIECEPGAAPFRMVLRKTRQTLWGTIVAASASGFHRYGARFCLVQETVQPRVESVSSWRQIAGAILQELAEGHPDSCVGEQQARALLGRLDDSVEKTGRYVAHQAQRIQSFLSLHGPQRFQQAEQSLIFGHPLHPTPKSSEGFSTDDVARYAPELGAAFTLSYFAVSKEFCIESPLLEDKHLFPADVLAGAARTLGPDRDRYRLIPCHPWQSGHLKSWPQVQDLLAREEVIDLGRQGGPVFPTSSVRTVWDPRHPYGFKLPLNVRITNFVRVNPLEHLQRAIDAGRVLSLLQRTGGCSDVAILLELGYRTIMPPGMEEEDRSRFAESWGVLLRENPFLDASMDCPVCVASLLEPDRQGARPRLGGVLASLQAGDPDRDVPVAWACRYMEIAVMPLLNLFLEHGVSIEGHVQNTLLLLRDGWPERLYIRDLEGVAISRSRAAARRWFDGWLSETSPAVMSDEEAWRRFKYYVVVNHLGHLLHALAWCTERSEMELWRIAAETLADSPARRRHPDAFDDLLNSETMPAKANLISCFLGRGDKPLYVAVPNPIREAGRCSG